MQTHQTGAIRGTRLGSVVVAQGYSLDIVNNLTASILKLCVIPATAAKPIAYRVRAAVVVADNSGTSSVLDIGTTSGGAEILSAVDLKAAAGTNYEPTNQIVVAIAETTLYAEIIRVGTAATTGQVAVIVELFEVNIVQPTVQEG